MARKKKYLIMEKKKGFNEQLHSLCVNKNLGIQDPEDTYFFWGYYLYKSRRKDLLVRC